MARTGALALLAAAALLACLPAASASMCSGTFNHSIPITEPFTEVFVDGGLEIYVFKNLPLTREPVTTPTLFTLSYNPRDADTLDAAAAVDMTVQNSILKLAAPVNSITGCLWLVLPDATQTIYLTAVNGSHILLNDVDSPALILTANNAIISTASSSDGITGEILQMTVEEQGSIDLATDRSISSFTNVEVNLNGHGLIRYLGAAKTAKVTGTGRGAVRLAGVITDAASIDVSGNTNVTVLGAPTLAISGSVGPNDRVYFQAGACDVVQADGETGCVQCAADDVFCSQAQYQFGDASSLAIEPTTTAAAAALPGAAAGVATKAPTKALLDPTATGAIGARASAQELTLTQSEGGRKLLSLA